MDKARGFPFFAQSYLREGPGVDKDAPKLKGAARYFELLVRNFGALCKLNLLCLLSMAPLIGIMPAVAFGVLDLQSPLVWGLSALALIAGLCAGPAMAAANALLIKMLRDDAFFFWHDFLKAFKGAFRQCASIGVIWLLMIGLQAGIILRPGFFTSGALVLSAFFCVALLFHMIFPCYFLQAACVNLGLGALMKNSLLLALGNAPRSLMAALCLPLAILAIAVFLPFLMIPALLLGYAAPALIIVQLLWPLLNNALQIEQRLQASEDG